MTIIWWYAAVVILSWTSIGMLISVCWWTASHSHANVLAWTSFSWNWPLAQCLHISFDVWWPKSAALQLVIIPKDPYCCFLFLLKKKKCYLPRRLLDNQCSCSSKVSIDAKIHNPTQAAERKLRNQCVNHPPVQGGRFKKMDDHANSPGCGLWC